MAHRTMIRARRWHPAPRPLAGTVGLTVFLSLAAAGFSLEAQEVPPGRFAESEVRFESVGATLAGAGTPPVGEGPHPAIVLVDGSGETDRGNMREFAIALAGAGFASLAYDKSGVGGSTGHPDAWAHFRIEDLAADAAAGASLLAGHPGVDADRVGILRMSQGGWVAPHAATLTDRISYMILLSPSVATIAEDRIFERAARIDAEGYTSDEVAVAQAMQKLYHDVLRGRAGFDRFEP